MTNGTRTVVDYYRVLGVGPDATPEEVRVAYRAKVRLWHPDLVAGQTEEARRDATETTARLNEAYAWLSDPHRRTAYDASLRAHHASGRQTPVTLLVSPRTSRCDVAPGDTIRLTLDVRARSRADRGAIRVRAAEPLTITKLTATEVTGHSARLELRLETFGLSTDRVYHIPIRVTWGELAGTVTLMVRTTGYGATGPDHRSGGVREGSRHRRRSDHRKRDVLLVCVGGLFFPLLVLAWISGLTPAPPPANAPLIGMISGGALGATTWMLASTRLLRRPARMARFGAVWSRLMRWSGWALVGACVVFLGVPSALFIVPALLATPFLGLLVTAAIVGRFGSRGG